MAKTTTERPAPNPRDIAADDGTVLLTFMPMRAI